MLIDAVNSQQLSFLGVVVCTEAFKILTGVSSGSMQNAREAARKGQQTVISRADLGLWQSVRNTGKAHKYLES